VSARRIARDKKRTRCCKRSERDGHSAHFQEHRDGRRSLREAQRGERVCAYWGGSVKRERERERGSVCV